MSTRGRAARALCVYAAQICLTRLMYRGGTERTELTRLPRRSPCKPYRFTGILDARFDPIRTLHQCNVQTALA